MAPGTDAGHAFGAQGLGFPLKGQLTRETAQGHQGEARYTKQWKEPKRAAKKSGWKTSQADAVTCLLFSTGGYFTWGRGKRAMFGR